MNPFSDVDRSGRALELVDYLDHAHRGLHAPKILMRAGLDLAQGSHVLDLGCGTGHELIELERAGWHAYGIDSSAAMLDHCRARLKSDGLPARLTLGDAHRLPFPDRTFDGCRIERVLQHLADPATALKEVRRVLRPGGRLAVMEPDWASFTLASADTEAVRAVADSVGGHIPHREIGRHLRRLLVDAGFEDLHSEVDLAVYRTTAELSHVISLERAAERAWTTGRIERSRAETLLLEQRDLSESGGFHATLNRVVVAWARSPAQE
ncbi:methyltransferase domain-containing protein [Streptomyces sp. NPDC048623]|uniref:methyltransferase domain-containing protein n=1 Tax=Streptomyces sp. NPDC048623 TaxID=3155761 RepID=UPI003446BCD2